MIRKSNYGRSCEISVLDGKFKLSDAGLGLYFDLDKLRKIENIGIYAGRFLVAYHRKKGLKFGNQYLQSVFSKV